MKKTAGQIGYEAYADDRSNSAILLRSSSMPLWEELTPEIQQRWEYAAAAIQNMPKEAIQCVPDQTARTLQPGESWCSEIFSGRTMETIIPQAPSVHPQVVGAEDPATAPKLVFNTKESIMKIDTPAPSPPLPDKDDKNGAPEKPAPAPPSEN